MRTMFYALVTAMTEAITGLESESIKLWEIEEYLSVYGEATKFVNLGVLIVIACVCYTATNIGMSIYRHIRTRKTLSD